MTPTASQSPIYTTVSDYLTQIGSSLKPSTAGIYQRRLDTYIAPYFGSVELTQLNSDHVQQFVDTVLAKLSYTTQQGIVYLLKNALSGKVCPTTLSVTPAYKPRTKQEAIFAPHEQARLLHITQTSCATNHLCLSLAFYTGLRLGELCALQWQDITPRTSELHVRRTAQRVKNLG